MILFLIICVILAIQGIPVLSDRNKDKKPSDIDVLRGMVAILAGVISIVFWWLRYFFF